MREGQPGRHPSSFGGLLFESRELDVDLREFRLDTYPSLIRDLFLSCLGRNRCPAKRISSAGQLLQADIETTCANIIVSPLQGF